MGRRVPRVGVWLALTVALAILSWSRVVRAEEFGFRLLAHQTPAQMYVGQTVSVEVELQNISDVTWSPKAADRLAYHWRDAQGRMLVLDGRRTELPHAVRPGDKVVVEARVEIPGEPGDYVLEWRMLRENVHWFPRPTDGANTRVPVTVAGQAFVWEVSGLRVEPGELVAFEEAELTATLRNAGAATWSAGEHDFVAYHWWDVEGRLVEYEGARTAMPRDVAPGESIELEARVEAPPVEGAYRLELEPVRDGVSWFGPPVAGDSLSDAIAVAEPALRWGLLDENTPHAMPANAAVDVRVELANTGSEPWGSEDRLSYRWRDRDGRLVAEGARTPLPDVVAPGDSVALEARLFAPDQAGELELVWEIVREHVRWLGPSTVPAAEPVRVHVGEPALVWSLVEADEPPAIWVNGEAHVRVRVRNDGAETWTSEGGDNLAYHWLDADGNVVHFDGRRTRLPEPVAPGESVELSARIRAPREAGDYQLQFEMLREEVRWYGPPRETPEVGVWAQPVTVRWSSGVLQVLLALATAVSIVLVRRAPVAARPRLAVGLDLVPVLWAWASTSLVAFTFAELSGLGFWAGGRLYTLSGALLVCVPVLALRGRARAWILPVLLAPTSLLMLVDLVYMDFYGSIVPVTALTAAHHLGEVRASIVALFQPAYGWLLPAPLAALALALAWPRRVGVAAAATRHYRRVRWGALAVCLLGAGPALSRLYDVMTTELGVRVFSEQHNVARLGVLNAHLFDLARTVRELRRREASAHDREQLLAWFEARAAEVAAEEPSGFGIARGKNLLLIQVESAQTFLIGAEVGGREITPFMNRLHERGLYFPEIVDQTAQGKTSDGEYAVLSSQHPLRSGALCFLRADNRFVTLAHVLSANGYSTLSAHPFKRGFWNRAVLHPRYGFAQSLFRRELGSGPEIGWGLADGPFFERLVERLGDQPEPFFAFLITLSLHHPYDEFPSRYAVLDLGELEGTHLGNYLHGMNYFDRALEQLFTALEAEGLLDETVIALYGDHDARLDLDPALLEVAGIGSWSPSVYHRLERVPLFVVLPGGEPHGVVARVGGQVDVGPTLLHYLGIPRPRAFLGRALTPDVAEGFAAYPDGSAFADDRFFVAEGYDIPAGGACFDAQKGTARPLADCEVLRARAAEELARSRAVLDLDLHRTLADTSLVQHLDTSPSD